MLKSIFGRKEEEEKVKQMGRLPPGQGSDPPREPTAGWRGSLAPARQLVEIESNRANHRRSRDRRLDRSCASEPSLLQSAWW